MYRYYACNTARKKQCNKKVVRKHYIEDRVVSECRMLLTEKNISQIAKSVAAACASDYDNSAVKRLRAALKEAETSIENLWKALERGESAEMITERIDKRQKERDEIKELLAIETTKQLHFTAPQVSAFLHSLKKGNLNDENNRRGIINIFLRVIYLWDDRFTLVLNGGDRAIEIADIPLDDIEADNEEFSSSFMAPTPPPTTDCK